MKLSALADNPRPQGSIKMTGSEHYRVRQGDWRAVYAVDDTVKTIDIIKIGHRREVYRK